MHSRNNSLNCLVIKRPAINLSDSCAMFQFLFCFLKYLYKINSSNNFLYQKYNGGGGKLPL